MTYGDTMTIRISPEVKEKLGRLASDMHRSESLLAGEAVSVYVDHELSVIEGIQRGLDDVAAGRVVTHDEAMAELDAAIDSIQVRKA